MNERGVLYVKWGNSSRTESSLTRSIESVKKYHPELPIHVENIDLGNTDNNLDHSNLLIKTRMLDISPFEETLFLDTDTVVLGRLDFGFFKAKKFGIACCICESPWGRRYGGLDGDMVEYNTGVLFFTKQSKSVFDLWKKYGSKIDSSIKFMRGEEVCLMPLNDQAGFAYSVDKLNYPLFVLPLNWNFRPQWHKSFFGPIKIWHDYMDVPSALIKWNETQSKDEIIRYCEF